MKVILLSVKLIITFLFFSSIQLEAQQNLNMEVVQKIKKDTTIKAEIIKWFGMPNSKSLFTDKEEWFYNQDQSKQLIIYFNRKGVVTSFTYTGEAGKTGHEDDAQKRVDFIELVRKVQEDKSIYGEVMYKGVKATIQTDKNLMTTIGRFININWNGFTAHYHNTLGYMTRSVYNNMGDQEKLEKNQYCIGCAELIKDKHLPYILSYQRSNTLMREIK